jgi:hypothetical protein
MTLMLKLIKFFVRRNKLERIKGNCFHTLHGFGFGIYIVCGDICFDFTHFLCYGRNGCIKRGVTTSIINEILDT